MHVSSSTHTRYYMSYGADEGCTGGHVDSTVRLTHVGIALDSHAVLLHPLLLHQHIRVLWDPHHSTVSIGDTIRSLGWYLHWIQCSGEVPIVHG